MNVPPLPEGCPWSGWALPNVNWCEENLCSWIVNPANTWSNLAYIILGAAMWWMLRKSADPVLRYFGLVSIVVGLFSGIYHASYTFFFQFFDFLAMFLFVFLPIVINFRRLGMVAGRRQWVWYGAGVTFFSILVLALARFNFPIQALVAVLVVVTVGQEILLRQRKLPSPPVRLFVLALMIFVAGGACSALDVSRVWCDPTDHVLQGHATWHVLTAIALMVLSRFYAREPQSA